MSNVFAYLLRYLTCSTCFVVFSFAVPPHFASAQTDPSRTVAGAAGISIMQQNKMRQELHDTKRELKAIREGLGIEEQSHHEVIGIDTHEKILIIAIPLILVLFVCFGAVGFALHRFIFHDKRSRLEKRKIVLVGIASWVLFVVIPFPIFLIPILFGAKPGTDAEPYMALGTLCSAGLIYALFRLRRAAKQFTPETELRMFASPSRSRPSSPTARATRSNVP